MSSAWSASIRLLTAAVLLIDLLSHCYWATAIQHFVSDSDLFWFLESSRAWLLSLSALAQVEKVLRKEPMSARDHRAGWRESCVRCERANW